MREILFRGKTEKGEWVYGFYHNETSIESPSSDRKITRHHIYTQDFDKFVIPETVGQFTGLTDKNGNKVFEGDIVIAPIYYDIGCYPHTENKTIVVTIPKIYNRKLDGKMEVIGNIHDKPELLGEQR